MTEPDRSSLESPRVQALALVFVLSGAASLIDQVVWLRFLSLTFGNTTYAAATLLAIFMAGLGFGALLFGRLADRLRRPLLIYALLELGIGLFAVYSPRLFALIDSGYVLLYRSFGSEPLFFATGRAALAAVCLLPPTLAMGATLPLMLKAVVQKEREVGRLTAIFYALNTLGATGGTALAGFVTIRLIGLHGSLLVAAGLNLVVGVVCVLLQGRPEEAGAEPALRRARDLPAPIFLATFFVMGATSLALEVLWTRILVFYLGSTVYAYSLMLVAFLLGVGGGSLVMSFWIDRLRRPYLALVRIELLMAACSLLQVFLFSRLNDLLHLSSVAVKPDTFSLAVLTQLLAILPILVLPTLLMGLSFPIAVRLYTSSLGQTGGDVGAVYAANTIGSVAGSLGAGFLFIPWIGTQNSLLLVGATNLALAAALFRLRPRGEAEAEAAGAGTRMWLPAAACALAFVLMAIFFPHDRVILSAGIFQRVEPDDLVYFDEDASSSVTVIRRTHQGEEYLSLELNGVNVAGTSPDLYAVQKMQGHLPLILGSGVESLAHIGFGSGGTAHAVSTHPVKDILVVEISAHVLRASDRFFADINHGVLDDERVEVELNDGRNFLLATPRRFDAILSDSIHPRFAGNGSLYSLEYFRLVRSRLAEDGVVSMWLPMYTLTHRNFAMILKAFNEVFSNVVVWYEPSALNSFTIVSGKNGEAPWSAETLRTVFADERVLVELADIGIQSPADVLACYMVGSDELDVLLADVPPHVDDFPSVEYESGTLFDKSGTWTANFFWLVSARPEEPPERYLAALDEAERERARELYDERKELLDQHLRFLIQNQGRPAGAETQVASAPY